MQDLIEKVINIEPCVGKLKGKSTDYAFGFIDAINLIVDVIKSNSLNFNTDTHIIAEQIVKKLDDYSRVDFSLKTDSSAYVLPVSYEWAKDDMINIIIKILNDKKVNQ